MKSFRNDITDLEGEQRHLFVGRKSELGLLISHAQAAANSRGCVVAVSSAAGCGKSTIIERFLEEVNEKTECDYEIMVGRCIDADAMPYLPFVDAMRKYFKVFGLDQTSTTSQIKEMLLNISKDLANLIPVIGPMLTVGVTVAQHARQLSSGLEVEQGTLFFAVSEILSGLSKKRPLILILEDIHWADRSTLHLVQYLADELRNRRILLIVTYRPDRNDNESYYAEVVARLIQKGMVQEIRLLDFAKDEYEAYLSEVFENQNLELSVKNTLFSQTHGNPFFLSQIIPVLLRENLIVQIGGVWRKRDTQQEFTIPGSVEATVHAVLRRLEPSVQTSLEIASVIGERFSYPVLASTTEIPESDLESQIDSLVRNSIITELPRVVDVYEFIHAITREVVYRQIFSHKRRRIHLSVAQTIEKMYSDNDWEVLEILAYHYQRSMVTSKAAEYQMKSASKAIAILAYDEALNYCQAALANVAEDDPFIFSILSTAGYLADHTGQWSLAKSMFETMLRTAEKQKDQANIGNAYHGLAMAAFRQSDWKEAEHLCGRYIEIVEQTGTESERSRANVMLGRIFWRTGHWDTGVELLNKALYTQQRLGLIQEQVVTMGIIGVIFRNQGENQKALDLYRRIIELYDHHTELDMYWLGITYNRMGTVFRSIARQEDNRSLQEEESVFWNRAVDTYEKSVAVMSKIGSWRDLGNTYNNLAMIYRSKPRADYAMAMECCEKAEAYLAKINSPIDVMDTKRHMGVILAKQDKVDEARTRFDEGIAISEIMGPVDRSALLYSDMAQFCDSIQDYKEAVYYYDLARKIFTDLGAHWRVNELDSTFAHFSEALPPSGGLETDR